MAVVLRITVCQLSEKGEGLLLARTYAISTIDAQTIIVQPTRGKENPRRKTDAVSSRCVVQLGRVHGSWQIYPEDEAAARVRRACSLRKMPENRGADGLNLRRHHKADAPEMALVASVLKDIEILWRLGGLLTKVPNDRRASASQR